MDRVAGLGGGGGRNGRYEVGGRRIVFGLHPRRVVERFDNDVYGTVPVDKWATGGREDRASSNGQKRGPQESETGAVLCYVGRLGVYSGTRRSEDRGRR